MKRFALLAVAVAASATVGIAAGVARADNGAQTTHFTATYYPFTCSGERIVKTGPKAFIKDSETCLDSFVGDIPPGTYDLAGSWLSDYDYFVLGTINFATSGTLVVTLNSDGTTTWNITAYYANP